MSRRLMVLFVGTAMAALMLAMAGVAWAGGDTTPPTVVRTLPADGKTGFDRDDNIKVKFSEAMMRGSIDADSVYLTLGHRAPCTESCPPPCPTCPSNTVGASVRYNAEKRMAIINPSNRLARRTEYSITVEGAGGSLWSDAVKDRAGNEMAADYISYFTTGRT